jgi:hypothetical protein
MDELREGLTRALLSDQLLGKPHGQWDTLLIETMP